MSLLAIQKQFPRSSRSLLWWAIPLAGILGCLVAARYLALPGVLLAFGGCLALLLSAVHPLISFSLYFCALFFADTRVPGVPVSINQVLALVFLLSWGVYFLRGRTISLNSPFVWWLIPAVVFFAISALTGESEERGIVHFRYVLIYYFLGLAVASCLGTDRAVFGFAWLVLIMTAGAAVVGVVEAIEKNVFAAFAGRWTDAQRISGTAKNSIVYAWNLLFCFPFAFFLFSMHRRPLWRYLALGLGFFVLGVALLTFNRQTFLLIGFIVVLCALLFRYRDRKALLTIVMAGAVTAGAVLMPSIVNRVMTLGNISRDASYLDRRDQFLVAMEMYRQHPLTGVGLGSYPALWRKYIPEGYPTYDMQYQGGPVERYPDAGYVQLIAETGLIGLAMTLAIMAYVLLRARKSRRMARELDDDFAFNFSSMLLVLGLYWVVSNLIQDTFLYVRVWLLLGLVVLLHERILLPRREEPAEPA